MRYGINREFKKILTLAFSNLGLQLLGFMYRTMLAKTVGTEVMGLNSLVMQIYSLVISVCISGMNVTVITLASRTAKSNSEETHELLKVAIKSFVCLFIFVAAPILILQNQITTRIVGVNASSRIIICLLLCIFLTGFENVFKSIHIGNGKTSITALSELLEQITRFILVYLLLRYTSINSNDVALEKIYLGMIGSEGVSISILLHSYSKKIHSPNLAQCYGKKETEQVFFRILIPATATAVIGTAFESVSNLLLPQRLVEAGYTREYAISTIGALNGIISPIVAMPMCFIGAMNIVRQSRIASATAHGDLILVRKLIKVSICSVIFVALVFYSSLGLYINEMFVSVYGFIPNSEIIVMLCIKMILVFFQITCMMILNSMMMQKKVLIFTVIGEAVQMILIYILTANPFLHIYGYIFASLIGELIKLLLCFDVITKIGHAVNKK